MNWLRIIFFLVLFFFIVRPIYTAFFFTRPPRIRVRYFTPTALGVTYEDVQLRTGDGLDLEGWYIPSRNGAAVLLLHRHGGNRLGIVQHAEALIRAGYGVLMLDLRAHGNSGGGRFGRSELLVEDVLTAVSFLRKRPEIHAAGIGVAGVAAGGMIALHAAARTVAIRAIFADAPSPARFADLPPARTPWGWVLLLPQRLFMHAAGWFWRAPPLPANQDAVAQLKGRSLFLVATGRGLEQQQVRALAAQAEDPKTVLELPRARHAQGWYQEDARYMHRMTAFFDRTLKLEPTNTHDVPQDAAQADTAAPDDAEGEDATVSMLTANLIAILFFPLVYLLFFLPYRWLWQQEPLAELAAAPTGSWILLFLALLVGTAFHEGLHLWGFMRLGGAARDQIKVGFNWRGLAPFAHCKAPLNARAYRQSLLLPGIVLGVLPAAAGLLLGQWWVLIWGGLMVIAAGGDAAVFWALRGVPGTAVVRDHPTAVGCTILSADEEPPPSADQ